MRIANMRHERIDPYNAKHFYIGRGKDRHGIDHSDLPNFLANPFKLSVHGTRLEVIAKYKRYLWEHMKKHECVKKYLRELPDDATLFCWCYPQSCHGEVIIAASEWLKRKA